jgi:hypothetical protein
VGVAEAESDRLTPSAATPASKANLSVLCMTFTRTKFGLVAGTGKAEESSGSPRLPKANVGRRGLYKKTRLSIG